MNHRFNKNRSRQAPATVRRAGARGRADSDLSFYQLTERYPDEASAIRYFTAKRWPDGPYCPDCGSTDVYDCKAKRRLPLLKCRDCGEQFTVISGTVMEGTKLPLRKWLFAFHMIGGAKKSLPSRYMARQLGMTVKSAWHLTHRIRKTMEKNDQVFTGIVESDEAYIGGRRKHVGHGYRKNKIAIQTIVQRRKRHKFGPGGKRFTSEQSGQAQTIALDPEADRVDGRTVGAKLRKHTDPDRTVLMTDESPIYTETGKGFKEHHKVNHKREDYAHVASDGHLVHTNTAEGLFANLKRQLHGTHHSVSKKHLPRYLEEYDNKYNTRDLSDTERTEAAIGNIEGRRVTLFKSESGEGDSLHDRKASEPSKSLTKRGASRHKRTGKKAGGDQVQPANVDAQVEAARAVLATHGNEEEKAAVAAAGGRSGGRSQRRASDGEAQAAREGGQVTTPTYTGPCEPCITSRMEALPSRGIFRSGDGARLPRSRARGGRAVRRVRTALQEGVVATRRSRASLTPSGTCSGTRPRAGARAACRAGAGCDPRPLGAPRPRS